MFAKKIYFVGIKGTGMSAFAELLHAGGHSVSGSDTNEQFYTEESLRALNIDYYRSFDAAHVPPDAGLVIHSAAYDPIMHVELVRARQLGIPVLKYADALGEYSRAFFSAGVAGTHGKTTTTALAGCLLRALGVPAKALAGSATGAFARSPGGAARPTLDLGNKYFVAETCEYRGHFLSFQPRLIVLTGVEHDHQDFFPSYESTLDMFVRYAGRLPRGGVLVYCADDEGAREVALRVAAGEGDIRLVPYGQRAGGPFQVRRLKTEEGLTSWRLAGFEGAFELRIPGAHNALNASAALACAVELFADHYRKRPGKAAIDAARAELAAFRGTARRCEIVGEAAGVLIVDDYAHHPTAVAATLAGLRAFYPGRRLVLSFMPHTYSRTLALLDSFARCFEGADVLFLHKIYPSARERVPVAIAGDALYAETRKHRAHVNYIESHEDAWPFVAQTLKPGDLFVTMGAGDNWKLGRKLLQKLTEGW